MIRYAAYALLSIIAFAYMGVLLDEMNEHLARAEWSDQ